MSSDHGDKMVHRELDTTRDAPEAAIPEIIADLEDTEPERLPRIWWCIGDLLTPLFSDPPAPEADCVVAFSYQGYRITVEETGEALFVPTSD